MEVIALSAVAGVAVLAIAWVAVASIGLVRTFQKQLSLAAEIVTADRREMRDYERQRKADAAAGRTADDPPAGEPTKVVAPVQMPSPMNAADEFSQLPTGMM